MVNTNGAEIGTAQFTPAPAGVLIRVVIAAGGLSPGWHGMHLHAVGDCSDPAKFEHAAGHIQKSNTYHGLPYVHGPENGDLPNISAAGDGSAAAEVFTGLLTLADLQDTDGSALVIHANPDDHTSQPWEIQATASHARRSGSRAGRPGGNRSRSGRPLIRRR